MDLTLITWLIPVPPLLSFGLIVLFFNQWKRLSSSIAILSMVAVVLDGANRLLAERLA